MERSASVNLNLVRQAKGKGLLFESGRIVGSVKVMHCLVKALTLGISGGTTVCLK